MLDITLRVLIPVFFATAALGGLLTACLLLFDVSLPVRIDTGKVHGRIGVLATVLLLVYVTRQADVVSETRLLALAGFFVTIMVGGLLFFLIRRKGMLPKSLIMAHGVAAIASGLALWAAWP